MTLTIKILSAMQRLCETNEIPFFVMLFPEFNPLSEVTEAMMSGLRDEGVEFIDLRETPCRYFHRDQHPSASCHETLAAAIAAHERMADLIPPEFP